MRRGMPGPETSRRGAARCASRTETTATCARTARPRTVVLLADGLHVHVDRDGRRAGTGDWLDLGPFHKGFATACDASGWTHVDRAGRPAYVDRYAAVEPFYNGQARVLDQHGGLQVIDEHGRRVVELRAPRSSALQRLSTQMVGLWKTYAVRAAVELGMFDTLPASEPELVRVTGAPEVRRLMMALRELGLVREGTEWSATETGELLRSCDPAGMADASAHWARDAQRAWDALPSTLRSREIGKDWFASLAEDREAVASYQRAMAGYARNDYAGLADLVPEHRVFVDAGGGTGVLLRDLLVRYPRSRGVLLERPEVVPLAELPPPGRAVACDIRKPWPVTGDAVLLARVLHDWPDEVAFEILRHARAALGPRGRLYVVELGRRDGSPAGALLDVHLLAMTGGKERTVEELSRMIQAVGFGAPAINAAASCVMISAPAGTA
jgi:hypothetical protein